MTISEMLKNRADLPGQMRQFLDTHEDKQGKLSAEDHTTYQNMEAEFDSLTEAINRAKRIWQSPSTVLLLASLIRLHLLARRKRVVRPMPISRPCSLLCVPISARFPTFCRKAWMQMAVIWFPKNMTAV